MTLNRWIKIGALLVTLLVAWATSYHLVHMPKPGPVFAEELSDVILPSPKVLKSFQLVDHNRQPFGLEQLQGRWSFLFFGYTYCPDVCPTAMGILADFFDRMKKHAPEALENTRMVFVSVDPERDTPEHLQQYVKYFNPNFLGVTGKPTEIADFAKQVGAIFYKGAQFKDPDQPQEQPLAKPTAEDKMISHTSAFFLMDPLGRLVAIFPEYENSDMIFENYTRIRKYVKIRKMYTPEAW